MKDLEKEASRERNKVFIKLFKALANEERIQIILLLKEHKEMFAQHIQKHFYLEQSTTSYHLNTLLRAGIAKVRKEGRKIFYSLDYETLYLHLDHFRDLLK